MCLKAVCVKGPHPNEEKERGGPDRGEEDGEEIWKTATKKEGKLEIAVNNPPIQPRVV